MVPDDSLDHRPPAPTDDAVTAAFPRPASVPGAAGGRTVAGLAESLGARTDTTEGGRSLTGVTLDSRGVRPGDVYAALPGARLHGARFAADAVAAGAAAVLTDEDGARLCEGVAVPVLVVADPRGVLGGVSSWVYGHPAADLLMLGVTGTNGKTTTCYLIEAALRHAGRRTGMIGTVETRFAGRRVPSPRTTPESPDLHGLLAVMREAEVSACAMEVSSHALALHRVDAVRYDVAGFTNLSQDHLDFHPDLEDYFTTKASLFTPERTRSAVVCVDDPWGTRLAVEATVPVVTFRTPLAADHGGTGETDWEAVDLTPSIDGPGTEFTLRHRDGHSLDLVSPLAGDFNVANTSLAALMLVAAGFDEAGIRDGLASGDTVPGRMQVVGDASDGHPLAVVDYAHTPDAVTAALRALRRTASGRLVVVLGAGGDRDPGKREAMGAAAATGADVVVVTDDNPRGEDPSAIRARLVAGAREVAPHARSRCSRFPTGPTRSGRRSGAPTAAAMRCWWPARDMNRVRRWRAPSTPSTTGTSSPPPSAHDPRGCAVIALRLDEVVAATRGSLVTDAPGDVVVDGPVVTDSRRCGPGGLYVARHGEQADGHAYVGSARAGRRRRRPRRAPRRRPAAPGAG